MKSETNHHSTSARGSESERVAVEDSQPPRAADPDWNTTHAEVQGLLAALDRAVEARVPGVRIDSGRTSGRGFFLFSYRRFAPPQQSRIDPVIAGMTFKPLDDRIAVEADISGEESGDILEAYDTGVVSPTSLSVLHHAREIAQRMASAGNRVAAALTDTAREIH
jgi:hypothetical protein